MSTTVVESSADIVRLLAEYDLIGPSGLGLARALEKSSPTSAGPRRLLDQLVERGALTRFQAETILRGAGPHLAMGRWRLVDVIGSGSMGTVYKARSADAEVQEGDEGGWYAIKTVPRKNVVNLRSVAEKIAALEEIRHPRVSALIHIGTHADRVFVVAPLLEGGEKLDAVVRRHGKKLPARQSAQIGLQIASGLQAYHDQGLFHGLLKANEVLIGADRRVRILDFGVGFLLTSERGKALLSTTTNSKALARGLDCASPESIADPLARTIQGDQYSLGCILYFCLTGQYPFPDANPVKKMLGHQCEEPTPLRQLAPETPARLVGVVARLMRKDPEERYATTGELVHDLQAVTAGSSRPAISPPAAAGPVCPSDRLDGAAVAAVSRPPAPAECDEADEPAEPEPLGSGLWLTMGGIGLGVVAGVLAWLLQRGG